MAATCYWHPDRETGLQCGRCGKYVCVQCMRQHPVGIRCKECASATQVPTYQISTAYYARGIVAAVGLGVLGLGALYLVLQLRFLGFFFFIIMGLLGYLIGEGVGKAVNQRRGRPYQYMALGGALIATGPIAFASLFTFSMGALLNLLGVGIALMVAWQRRAP